MFESRIDVGSPELSANRAAMLELIGGFRTLEQRIRDLSASKRARFTALAPPHPPSSDIPSVAYGRFQEPVRYLGHESVERRVP